MVKFSKRFPWECPQYIDGETRYFIKDKHITGDSYEYALFSVPARKPEVKAKNKVETIFVLNGQDVSGVEDEFLIDSIIRRYIVRSYSDKALVCSENRKYAYELKSGKLIEILEEKQETGWMRYNECLNIAKEIIESRQTYIQQTLFDI